MKIGDAVHSILHPIAENVIDPVFGTDLAKCGGCAQRRQVLNQWGDELYDELFTPKKRKENNAVSGNTNNS